MGGISTVEAAATGLEQAPPSGSRKAKKAGYVQIIDESLCQLVGGHRVLLESELTKAHLLEFLKAKGFVREVRKVISKTELW